MNIGFHLYGLPWFEMNYENTLLLFQKQHILKHFKDAELNQISILKLVMTKYVL